MSVSGDGIVLFTYGFIPIFYYIMIIWAILSVLEMIAIQMIIPEMKPNLKGLYWVLKERQSVYIYHDQGRKEVKINPESREVISDTRNAKRKSGS